MDYLKLACDRLGVEPGKVMTHRVYEDHIALVVDNGRLGCPKYTIPLSDLQAPKPVTLPEPVTTAGIVDDTESTPYAVKPPADKQASRRRPKR